MDRPKPVPVRRRTKQTTILEKKIADDEFMAAAIGDTEWLRQSLRSKGGAISYDKNGLAPIHLASIHGRLECLKLMVDKLKIDVNLPSTTGWRPIHLAISNQTGKRSFQCLLYLLEKGADPSITNDDGITPMHQAASEGHVQCLKTLIEVGAEIDGEDRRGHKPIDLAKLWVHRKCARLLGAEMWHREKEFLSKELFQLQKVQMQHVMQDIEKDEIQKFDQQFYGEIAYRNWLHDKGLHDQSQKEKRTDQIETTKKNSLARANSEKSQVKTPEEQQHGLNNTRVKQSPESRDRVNKLADINESVPDVPPEKPVSASLKNNSPWNVSTHVPPYDYLPNLPDYYPRDMYTMQPKYPLKKGGAHIPNINMIPIKHESINSKANLRKPRLPPEMLEKILMGKDRPVVYKCQNIMDVQTLKRIDNEKSRKSETALHLCDDKNSELFRAALQNPVPSKSASNTSVASSSSVSSKLSAKCSVNDAIKI